MSSRSFRRRNNRRRHRSTPGGEQQQERRTDGAPGDQRSADGQAGPELPAESPPRRGPDRSNGQNQGQRGGREQRHGGSHSDARGAGQRRGGRAGQRGTGGRAQADEALPRPAVPLVIPDCPVCGKPVRELSSALTHRVSRQPAHFDCIVKELRESNEISPDEKLCYLGGGCFGILEFRPPGGPSRFVIKRRIQYEEKETPQDWKKPLQVPC